MSSATFCQAIDHSISAQGLQLSVTLAAPRGVLPGKVRREPDENQIYKSIAGGRVP